MNHRIETITAGITFLFLIVSSAGQKLELNVPSEYVLYSSEEAVAPLEIRCTGDNPLHWKTEVEKGYFEERIGVTFGTKYSSTLYIAEPFPMDTGNFTCYYDNGESVTTYVYIYDNQTTFVRQAVHETIYVNIGDPIHLDCRTTHPNITVTVFKNNVQDVTDRFQNDQRFYFKKKAESLQETGIYSCRGQGSPQENSWFVAIQPPVALHEPAIEEYSNSHHVLGIGFQLNCSVPVSRNDDPDFSWNLPRPITNVETMTWKGERSSSAYAISSLTVLNPTKYDSGTYTCIVNQGTYKKSVSKTINISEKIEPFVAIQESSKKLQLIPVKENEAFNWIIYFKGFPNNISYTFCDPFNNTLTDKLPRVTTDFNYNDGKVSLGISRVSAEDFGQYSVVLSASEEIEDTTFIFTIVNATPKIHFDSMPDTFTYNEPVFLNASILSFEWDLTEPRVTWWFNDDCPMGYGSCGSGTSGIQLFPDKIVKASEQIISNRYISPLTLQTNNSGVVESRIENNLGVNSTSTYIILSDLGGRFIFNLTVERKTVGITKNLKFEVVEGDSVQLICGALEFLYENVTLESTGILGAVDCSTDLSKVKCIKNPEATKDLNGSYNCSALNKMKKDIDSVVLELVVLEKRPPILLPFSNVSFEDATILVKELKPFNISCYVLGVPTPSITWFKDGENVEEISSFGENNEETITFYDNKQVVAFKFAHKLYEGSYTCHAENRVGVIEPSLMVQVAKANLSSIQWTLISLAVLFITSLCGAVAYLILRVKKERKFREELRQNQMYLFEKGNIGNLNPDCTVDEQADLLPYDHRYEVAKENVAFGKLLGSGAFGRVMEAKVEGLEGEGKWTRVAVKMCKDGADTSQLHALTLELKIMIHLGKHLNIVNLMGANTVHLDKGDLWILVEFCRYGNLLKLLQKNKSRFVNQIDPETGHIHPDRMSPFPSEPTRMSTPLSHGKYPDCNSFLPTDADGYLESKVRFGSLKGGEQHGRTPSTTSSNTEFPSTFRPGFYAGNPHYTTPFTGTTTTPNFLHEEPATANYVTATNFMPVKRSPSPKCHRTESIASSDEEYHKTLATDMTIVTSPAPVSPTSESVGNFSFDIPPGSPEPFGRGIPGVNAPLTTVDLICWSWQVANGMEYLSKRKVLHGDLAARNLLLADNNVIKISDFGLSRDMYKNDVYMKKGDGNMPIKWMAPEAIQEKVFSTQSDVWAFGITVWEIFTLGNTPYPGIPLDPNFTLLLENGVRMDKPKYATNDLYDLMLKCWRGDPMQRPNFALLSEMLFEMLSSERTEDYMAMNDVYMNRNAQWMANTEDYFNLMTSPDFANFQIPMTTPFDRYIPMESVRRVSQEDIHPVGYLDMASVKHSPPPSAAVFSPRPTQLIPSGNIFTFNGSEDVQSPVETSLLLQRFGEISEPKATLTVEAESLLRQTFPALGPCETTINNNNQEERNVDSQIEYTNLNAVYLKNKENYDDSVNKNYDLSEDANLNYVNITNHSKENFNVIPKTALV